MYTAISAIVAGEAPAELVVTGFVDTLRDHKKFTFVILRQGTDFVQVFVDKEKFPSLDLFPESFVEVVGTLTARPEVGLHGVEIAADRMTVLSSPLDKLPISHKGDGYPSLSERLDHRHLSLREPRIRLVFETMSSFDFLVREFCRGRGFMEIHTPKIIGTASEWGAELFSLDYFGREAYLAQSPQLYKQMAIAAGFERVLEIAPAFRADPSFTSRHVTEITMLDVEMSPIVSYEDVMEFEEDMLRHVFEWIRRDHGDKIRELFGVEVEIPEKPFPRISFAQAARVLEREYGIIVGPDDDMSSEGERCLAEYAKREYDHDFVFITGYPSAVRAFYTMREESDPRISRSFDLLYRGLEITSGAQREHRYDMLRAQILDKWMRPEDFEHYLACFRHSIPPHGGLGFWVARLFKQLFGFDTVKETIFLPRDPKRVFP